MLSLFPICTLYSPFYTSEHDLFSRQPSTWCFSSFGRQLTVTRRASGSRVPILVSHGGAPGRAWTSLSLCSTAVKPVQPHLPCRTWHPAAPPHVHAQTRTPSPEQLLEGQSLTPATFSEISQHITESSPSSLQTQTSSQQPTPPPSMAHSRICHHHSHSCVNHKALCHVLVSNSPAGFVDLSPKCL